MPNLSASAFGRPATAQLRPVGSGLSWSTTQAMFSKSLEHIYQLIGGLDDKLPLRDARARFGSKVSFEESRRAPVHRWYYYKEGFSPELLKLILDDLDPPRGGVFLDPFAGVGTSILAASQLARPPFQSAVGVEYNPFAAWVGSTKLRWREYDASSLRLLAVAIARHTPRDLWPVPPSATLRNRQVYPQYRLTELRRIRSAIDALADSVHKDPLRLALASILEPVSYAKKDGRALRILPRTLERPAVRTLFEETALGFADDIVRLGAQKNYTTIAASIGRGDARNLPTCLVDQSVNLSLFSPPYLNGIDYSEVYKVEKWFLGFIRSPDDLRRIRQGTLRSHASIRYEATSFIEDELGKRHTVARLLRSIHDFLVEAESRDFQSNYAWLVPAYFDDMFRVLKEQSRVLVPGGYSVCVVANSMFGDSLASSDTTNPATRKELWRLPIPSDALVAELARASGLRVVGALWVRNLRPRNVQQASSRETILVFRKPRRPS